MNSDLINVTAIDGLTLTGGSVALTNSGGLAVGTYTLINYAGTLGGAVANLGIPTGPAAFAYSLVNNATNTSIDLTVGIAGDYNGNGVVDAADYVLWRKGGPLQNEVDAPGTVNSQDYVEWRARFGNPSPGSGSGALGGVSTVPEPSAGLLALFAMSGLLATAFRR